MQINVVNTKDTDLAHSLTLMISGSSVVHKDGCPICLNRPPVWFADPASPGAMDPEQSAIGAPACCTSCLNALIADGTVEITSVDPDSF